VFKMTKNILRNLFTKKATRLFPYEKREPFKGARGELDIKIEDCIFCGLCQRSCPSNCIKVDRPNKKWEVNQFSCILCGVCTEVCPKKCLFMKEHYKTPVYTKNIKEHQQEVKPAASAEGQA